MELLFREERDGMTKRLKNQLSYLFFILLAVFAFYAVFHDHDFGMTAASIRKMDLRYLLLAVITALIFTMMEGVIIYYLLRPLQRKADFAKCIRYSFVGFFYSGITPSATGGQPMQLYHMNRDGNDLSASTIVLMTVALVYKFVLVLMGLGMVLFYFPVLERYLGNYLKLFYLGMALNTALVAVLFVVMVFPYFAHTLLLLLERMLVTCRLLKPSVQRKQTIGRFIESYQNAVNYLLHHKKQMTVVAFAAFVQRCLVFILPYIVYLGFGLSGTSALTILLIQMSIYLAVDMLPLPGAQGITELMYQNVFRDIFTAEYIVPAMCVSRGVSFYFLLFFSMAVCIIHNIRFRSQKFF